MESSSTSTKLDFYPFAYALFDECLEKHCWYCLDDEKKLKRCTGCQNAMFCDKNCQSLGWKDHKFECKGIKLNKGQVPDIEVRLLGRIVSRHKAILCGVDKKDPDFYKDRQSKRKIMEIWAHTERIKNDEYAMRKFEGIYERLCRFYDPKAMLNKQVVFELHCRDFINRHAISDKHYLREIGKGLYLDLCAYDHSCRPNTVYSCHSFIATLRSLDSKVNLLDYSSTFYSYIDLLCAKQDRRKLLKDTWYFTCECSRCQDESEQILSSMLCPNCEYSLCIFGKSEYKNSETQLITCPSCNKMLEKGQVLEAISAMCFISDVIEQTNFQEMGEINAQKFLQDLLSRHQKILPPINVYMCKIVQALLPFIDPNNSTLLLELHLNVENCLRLCYPHNHPALAFHLRNIGIFAKKLGQRQKALNYLGEALGMFKFVMGEGHSLYKITEEIIEEVKKELPEEGNEGKDIRKTGNEGRKVLEGEKKREREEDNEEGGKKEENEVKIKTEANQEGEAKLETEAIIEEIEAVKNKGKKRKKRQNKNKLNIITRDNCYDKEELNSEANTEKLNYEISKIEAKNKQALLKVEAPQIILIENEDKKEDKNDYNNNEKEQEECRYCLNNTVKDGGGVKKKLLQKKSVPRASTPMYCNNVWGGNREENKEIEDGKEEKEEDSSIRVEEYGKKEKKGESGDSLRESATTAMEGKKKQEEEEDCFIKVGESATTALIFLDKSEDKREEMIRLKIGLDKEEDKKEEEKEEKNEVKEEDENGGEWQLKQRRRKSRKYKLLNC
uniref:MYND-type domain-containing protein n=1 Tax=Meloidogyne enterolobii TaxID=390850 RepID=A0A6V7TKU8_MELEN|nr:unnamed protein product [Meloidogyne enterolobii]